MITAKLHKVIGAETTYTGHDPALGGRGARVRIIGIIRYDAENDSEDAVVRDDDRLHALGGVRSSDGADVLVWNAVEDRWGFVGHEVESVADLELFRHLHHLRRRRGEQ